jgi:PAS domain S-box-containing protein
MAALVAVSPLSVMLVRLRDHRIVAVSDLCTEMFLIRREQMVGDSVLSYVDDVDASRSALSLLASGGIDSYRRAEKVFCRPDGSIFQADTWVSAIADLGPRDFALLLALAAGHPRSDPGFPQFAEDADLLFVIGSVDSRWTIERVSSDVQALLGYRPRDIVGQPILDFVHAGDVAGLLTALGHAAQGPGGASTRLRLRAADGTWKLCRAMVSPLAGGQAPAFAFAIAAGQAAEGPVERVRELEEHLRRVGNEVRSAGVAAALADLPTTRELPELGRLSAREYEIVAQLHAGQRVPAIARLLFVSESTVRTHLTSIFRQFDVGSQQGLLDRLHEHRPGAP